MSMFASQIKPEYLEAIRKFRLIDDTFFNMHDFFCTDPAKMHYPQLAKRADFFKHKPKRMKTMCEIMEKIQEVGRAEGRAEGSLMMLTKLVLSNLKKNKPLEEIAESLDITTKEVIRIGKENGLTITH